ncbi:MAG: flagellar biosynthesis protein FlhA [Pirellulales bacterium]|nr:flagellar biosynthesis protein FlhA [Pirellulales bacterium]
MAPVGGNSARPLLSRGRDLILPVGLIASVLVILVPLPPLLMDLMLAANITLAVIMLLTTIYVRTPLEFSIFPTLLLASTLGRLVLNIATTRLILTRASDAGLSAAGEVIRSFGQFVAGDKVVVGLIIFIIIVLIQFVVITKGATRISEVAARFALDGMPGRQMAIDADLNAGIIDEHEAQRRRSEITSQADFFGAMDGASKFVRGDAIAGIMITLVNIVGGLLVGTLEAGMNLSDAASLFTLLTIGDGLVSQVPAFLVSVAAALLITRSTDRTNLPSEFIQQLFSRPEAMAVAAGFLGILVFTELPAAPLFLIASCCGVLAVMLVRKNKALAEEQSKKATEKPKETEERIEDYLLVDPMEVEVGVGLIRLADPNRGGDLLQRIHGVRQQVAADLGIIMPKVRIRDNFRLDQMGYQIKIADVAVANGQLMAGMFLALDSGATTGEVQGQATKDPAFGTDAIWIDAGQVDDAKMKGYTVVEPTSVLATHVTEIVRRHADEVLTRDATKHLLDELKATTPAVVDELIPKQMTVAEVQQILQTLLRESVSIRQLSTILEALGDSVERVGKDPVLLTEHVRNRLARTICSRYRDQENRLHVVTLDPALEDRIRAGIEHSERGLFVRMSPPAVQVTCERISKELNALAGRGLAPVVLVSPQIRAGLKQLTQTQLPGLVVLSYNEITRDTVIESVGMVTDAVDAPQPE